MGRTREDEPPRAPTTARTPAATLRAVRAMGERFDARFFEKDARHWPIARAAATFADRDDWPDPAEYAMAFAPRPAAVRFIADPPHLRRKAPVDFGKTYDGRIARGEVPTRPRMWHDFMNALVWATFPRAKAALHRQQHALYQAWATPGATRLPNARTREQDGLALVDEGGVVILASNAGDLVVPFGHALFEGIVLGAKPMIARGVVFPIAVRPEADRVLGVVDELLAERLDRRMLPEEMPRVPF